ncbi:unnamed protein product [Musa acuminata subsp. malaccensis]|uniref:(wild Malaysian banana) hypothetical protein n=1 Tax=Musa acuminata subsp. malaccensis TaxID=214687 RepID=A0A804I7X2_MUSAM|nr:PREDICTED: pentatricopeptide repeat-containing protein At4g02750-like isoform X1 [Musa acuminata subsp. malaccensis]CAG1849017.1 unnamed protein product [Musa acuminata subsp. malaccensis]
MQQIPMEKLLSKSKFLKHRAIIKVDDSHPFFWNTIIRSYVQGLKPWEAIYFFRQMLQRNVSPDKFTFPFILKACASAVALREGEQIHCHILKSPHNFDLFVQGSLIFMYASCQKIDSAHASFGAMLYKNLISWNMIIDAYVKHGSIITAFELFVQMPERDLFSWNIMIHGFTKNGQIESARRLFDEMPMRDIVSWNSIIDGYAKCRDMRAARKLFDESPIKDEVTWGIMLNGYAKCGQITIAHNWFEKLPYKNSINWNCLIDGYVRCGNIILAHKLFDLMPNRNVTSFNIMLDAYMKQGELGLACEIFDNMPVKDVVSWNIMIDGNARLGRITVSRKLFETMPCRDVVSWNTMIAGYKDNGESKEAVELFTKMNMLGEKPDCSTLAIVLSAIADLGFFLQGRWVHAYIDRYNIPLDGVVGVALIDMYSKCGYVDIALSIFDDIPRKERDHWNSIISGLAVHGHGSLAISLFQDMEQSMVGPDDITFIGLLSACSHAGLVYEGQWYFKHMSLKYGISPKIQHYGCMVDLLSRAGHLEEAIALVNNMPVSANDIIWRALLGASRNHGNIEIAEFAARQLIELVPRDSSSYVLLSNIYVFRDQHESAKELWKTMKKKGVSKTIGCSCIEIHGFLHEFTVGRNSHPQIKEIYLLLDNMTQALRLEGYLADVRCSLFDIEL